MTSTKERGNDNTLVFLLSTNSQVVQYDSYSGPNVYAYAKANASYDGRIVWGHQLQYYGSGSGQSRLTIQEPVYEDITICCSWCWWCTPSYSTNDNDHDGIVDQLEWVVGTDSSSKDSDYDAIRDDMELWGTDGFSFSEGGDPTIKDIWIELDIMAPPPTGSGLDPTPPPENTLEDDVADGLFTTGGINTHVIRDDVDVTFHENLVLDDADCPDGRVCTNVSALKAVFSNGNPYFHYAIWGYNGYGDDGKPGAGVSTLGGRDFIVSMAQDLQRGLRVPERGVFVHELGHNYTLEHNGNDNKPRDGPNSVVHESVMNYRYSRTGIGPLQRPTFSHGPDTQCASCATSPKQSCVDLRSGTNAFLRTMCYGGYIVCDCDINEWDIVKSDSPNRSSLLSFVDAIVNTAEHPADDKSRPADDFLTAGGDIRESSAAAAGHKSDQWIWNGPVHRVAPDESRRDVDQLLRELERPTIRISTDEEGAPVCESLEHEMRQEMPLPPESASVPLCELMEREIRRFDAARGHNRRFTVSHDGTAIYLR